jgi:Tfp pilus assembly protein PilX
MKNNLNSNGMALTIVMITLILLSLVAAYALNLSYNQHKLFQSSTGKRVKIYYAAQAGAVDAEWRIRTNAVAATCSGACNSWSSSGGDFTAAGSTASYALDIDGDGVNDVVVAIGAVNANGLRPIDSTGIDHY